MIRLRMCRIVVSFAVFVGGLFLIALVGISQFESGNLRGTDDIDSEDLFRRVEPNYPNTHIHSAFWDTRQKPSVVRILVLSSLVIDESKTHECLLDYGDRTVATQFTKRTLRENLFYPHNACYFTCQPDNNDDEMPKAVAIRRSCENGANCDHRLLWKVVQSLKLNADFKESLAVCVRPFFGPFEDTFGLAEFIAYYEIMGAQHFYFFDYQISPAVSRLVDALQSDPNRNFTIEMKKWNLPEHVLVWEEGQAFSIQYCVHHVMPKYKYLAIVDIDEHLVPRNPRHTLLSLVREHDRESVGTFIFHNWFFCQSSSQAPGLPKIATHTRRNRLASFKYRTKVILKPLTIVEEGVHFTYEWVSGFEGRHFELEVASLNHYRGQFCTHDDTEIVLDTYASDSFANQVINSHVLKTWKTLSDNGAL